MAGVLHCLDLEKEGPAPGEVLEGVRGERVERLWSELLPGGPSPLAGEAEEFSGRGWSAAPALSLPLSALCSCCHPHSLEDDGEGL